MNILCPTVNGTFQKLSKRKLIRETQRVVTHWCQLQRRKWEYLFRCQGKAEASDTLAVSTPKASTAFEYTIWWSIWKGELRTTRQLRPPKLEIHQNRWHGCEQSEWRTTYIESLISERSFLEVCSWSTYLFLTHNWTDIPLRKFVHHSVRLLKMLNACSSKGKIFYGQEPREKNLLPLIVGSIINYLQQCYWSSTMGSS